MAQAINIENIQVTTTDESLKEIIQSKFITAYQGDDLKRRVTSILGLKDIHGWSIVDTFEDEEKGVHLALVHYNDDADMSLLGHLRGVLVDVVAGCVIAKSFGETPTAVADSITEVDGKITITDKDGAVHNFVTSETTIKRAFDGVVLRYIWHQGEGYCLTHRKIKPLKSRWGTSATFLSMRDKAGGPTYEQLFDTTKLFSSTCYVFLVCDPVLLVGTRQFVTHSYIVFLAKYEMDVPYPKDDTAPGVSTFESTTEITGVCDSPFIHNPLPLSIEEANNHLQFGYYNSFTIEDKRQLTGESVIVYCMKDDNIIDIVRVNSTGNDWRSNLRGNNPNLYHQFCSLLNWVHKDTSKEDDPLHNKAWADLNKNLILLPLYDEDSLKELHESNGFIITLPSQKISRDTYATKDSRIYLLWMNYLLSLPLSIQGEALELFATFRKDKTDLINWLIELEASQVPLDKETHHRRVKSLIESVRKIAKDRVKDKDNYSGNKSYMSIPTVIKTTIRNFINKENGPSTYTLIREMKKARKLEQEGATVEA